MRYAFYISGKSRRLSKFLAQAKPGILEQLVVVVTDLPLEKELRDQLLDFGLQIREYDYKQLPGINNKDKNLAFSNELLSILEAESIDYCISFGSHILSGDLLEQYKYRIINFHPAILPLFPGIKAIDQAVRHGNVLLLGNTAHFIDSGIDTGPVIMQSVTTMKAFSDTGDYDSVLDLQIPMLNSIIEVINNGDLGVKDGRVLIRNARYNISGIYPEYSRGGV